MRESVSAGVQKRKRIVVRKPQIPVATALVQIPRAAMMLGTKVSEDWSRQVSCPHLAFLVSSATCPEASKPVITPEEKSLI